MRKSITAVVVATFSMLYAESAFAGGPSAALLVGNGFKDGFNVGIGARAGITLPMNVYVGGTFVYHLGTSVTTPVGDATFKVLYLGAEGGYDISAGPLTIRPYLGLGYASASGTVLGVTSSEGKGALWPGAVAIFPIGGAFVGADVRYVLVLDSRDSNGDSYNVFSAFATGGVTF